MVKDLAVKAASFALIICWSAPLWAQGGETAAVSPPQFAVPIVQLNAAPPRPMQEPSGLADVIRAKYPLAVKYKDLGLGWRVLDMYGTSYYTKGDSHWLNGVEYLVAYRFAARPSKQLDKLEYIASVTNNVYQPDPEDRANLTLLRMVDVVPQITGGNANVRSFDGSFPWPQLKAGNFSDAFNQSLALLYLRKIHDAVMAYSRAYLDVLPPLESAFEARQALLPYAENPVIFTRPGTDQPFKANPLFSNRKRSHLRKRGGAILFYEAQPAPDGLRAVLLLNGNALRVDAKQWDRLRKLSDLD